MKFIVILFLLASTSLQTSATDSEDVEYGDDSFNIFDSDYSVSNSASIGITDRIPCVFRGEIKTHGLVWTLNSCTECRCENGTIFCNMETCETDPRCQAAETVVEEGGCCPHCPYSNSTRNCFFRGQIYRQKENVRMDPCTVCTCEVDGKLNCHVTTCPSEYGCDPSEILLVPDVCCPKCPYKLVVESVQISREKNFSFDGDNSNTVKFSVHVAVNSQMSSRIVRGEQMWRLVAWMSRNKKGLGKRKSKQQNIFNEEHAAKPYHKHGPGRFKWFGLRYRIEHGEGALKRYLCAKFNHGKDPRPLHDLPFIFHPVDYNKNKLVACMEIRDLNG